jgi:signal transduction histidine kinase/DNA-binding response OmpR family regulator/HAMP domain-containing protein
MKINAKLLLLTFTIIASVSITSAFIYHTLTKELLLKQQSKNLINSANDFIYTFQQFIDDIDTDFQKNLKTQNFLTDERSIDFIFKMENDSVLSASQFMIKPDVKIYTDITSLKEFYDLNRNLIIRQKKINDEYYYYGKVINPSLLTNFAEKVRCNIAYVESGVITYISNNNTNEQYLPSLSKAARELNGKNNFELFEESENNFDLFVTHYSPIKSNNYGKDLEFIVFSISDEAATFRNTMNLVTLVIVITGIFLTIVFLYLFTTGFRKQLDFISKGVSAIANGNLDERVKIISKDEIGNLGNAFNNMLDEIKKRDNYEKEYTEFISLINKKPTLEEISEITIEKIISSTKVDLGGIYLLDNNQLIPLSVYGIPNQTNKIIEDSTFYKRAIENKEICELEFTDNSPIVKTGLAELKINYLYILPIVYNNEVIAIMELASVNKPINDIHHYYDKIKDQLAIGIANGKAYSKLQKLVDELQKLNLAYQKQNSEIIDKNKELVELHDKLKKGSEELEIQRAKAVESSKLKSQFLANMSHELRTPQNSILGLTELILKDSSTDSKTRERLNVVLRNGKKLLNLIENILEFSKLESGNITLSESEIQLSDLVSEVKSFISPIFLEREIEFIISYSEEFEYLLKSDIKKIEQIIYNLIGNAAKFTKDGYVKLEFSILNNNLIISVEDTGPGISDEDKKIIFEEFRQVDASLNRKFSGTGLGLAICEKYTRLLKGEITLKSELGKGSNFIVTIPDIVKRTILKEHKKIESQVLLPTIFKTAIISDGDDSTKLISDYLRSNNIVVEVPQIDEINLMSILESSPDVIILDILMKSRNGWQLLYKLKENKAASKIPLILLNMDEEANCGLGFNIYDFVAEEMTRNNIIRSVEEIENKLSIKFRKLLFILDDNKYQKIENELLADELKIFQTNGSIPVCDLIKRFEPDVVMIDLFNKNFDAFRILNDINEDIFSKNIPIIAFINNIQDQNEIQNLNNKLFETTLIAQHHPLDVLKIIKDRIELIDLNVFNTTMNKIEESIEKINSNQQQNYSDSFNILLVDDDNDARFTIGEIIKSIGYNPIYAKDGFECLEVLNSERPDLVLLDIMMPKMDGFQTIKKIRQNSATKNLKVYALTAYAMLSDREIIEKNGFDGLFTKPINTGQLEKKLRTILKLTV